jgi:hypothetical protein
MALTDRIWKIWFGVATKELDRRLKLTPNDVGGPGELKQFYFEQGFTVTEALDSIREKHGLDELQDLFGGEHASRPHPLAGTLKKKEAKNG